MHSWTQRLLPVCDYLLHSQSFLTIAKINPSCQQQTHPSPKLTPTWQYDHTPAAECSPHCLHSAVEIVCSSHRVGLIDYEDISDWDVWNLTEVKTIGKGTDSWRNGIQEEQIIPCVVERECPLSMDELSKQQWILQAVLHEYDCQSHHQTRPSTMIGFSIETYTINLEEPVE